MDYVNYFEMLKNWKQYPSYRLETRIDSLIGFFLPEIITEILSIPVSDGCIIPEFPIRKCTIETDETDATKINERSYKVDFYARTKDGSNLFVEIKSDSNSLRDKQNKYLLKARNTGMKKLVEGIVRISRKSRKQTKYKQLFEKMQDVNILDNSNKFIGNDPIEIIYVKPHRTPEDKDNKVIGFSEISELLKNKYPQDDFIIPFANALEHWSKD
jgi:hypothetical protein